MKQNELVVSVSKIEYIEAVLKAGADAVCICYRSFVKQHGDDLLSVLEQQLTYVHSLSKKLYFAFDFFAHNEDIAMLKELFLKLQSRIKALPDAIVVYDPGVFRLVKIMLPAVAIHISATMNVTNNYVCDLWKTYGATRVELAHVLSSDAAIQLAQKHVEDVETGVFIYGIPCISYSGRKLLSGFLEECHVSETASEYFVMEEQRQGEYYKVEQDERGTYVFASKMRNWLSEVGRLSKAGVTAFYIEGMAYDDVQLIQAVSLCKQAINSITD